MSLEFTYIETLSVKKRTTVQRGTKKSKSQKAKSQKPKVESQKVRKTESLSLTHSHCQPPLWAVGCGLWAVGGELRVLVF